MKSNLLEEVDRDVDKILFAYRKKETFEASPRMVTRKLGSVPLLSIIGLVVIAFYGFEICFGILTRSPHLSASLLRR